MADFDNHSFLEALLSLLFTIVYFLPSFYFLFFKINLFILIGG